MSEEIADTEGVSRTNGEWTVGRGDSRRTGVVAGTGPAEAPEQIWRIDQEGTPNGLAVAGDAVFVASKDGSLYAIDRESGATSWEYDTGKYMHPEPAVDDELVAFGNGDGTLFALEADSGEARWTLEDDESFSEFRASSVLAKSLVFAATTEGRLYAVDRESGEPEWTVDGLYDVRTPLGLTDGTLFVATDDRDLVALDAATGEEQWTAGHDGLGGLDAAPSVADGQVFVGAPEGKVHAYDAASGEEAWAFETGNRGADFLGVPVVDGTVYAVDDDGDLYALDAETGEERWSASPGGAAPPAVDGDTVFAAGERSIVAFDADSGDEVFAFDVGGGPSTGPVVADGAVYAGTGGREKAVLSAGDEAAAESADVAEEATGEAPTSYAGSSGDSVTPEPREYAQAAATDDAEPSDEQIRAAMLGVLIDEWQETNKESTLSLADVAAVVEAVVPGASEGLVKHNAERLADDFFVEFEPAYETLSLRAIGVHLYEELTEVDVYGEAEIRDVLEPLYQHQRHNPDSPTLSREELQSETFLEDDELDRIMWYLSDIGLQAGGLYIDNQEGYVDLLEVGDSEAWWVEASLSDQGNRLYEQVQ